MTDTTTDTYYKKNKMEVEKMGTIKDILLKQWSEKMVVSFEDYEMEIDSQIKENDFSEHNRELLNSLNLI